MPLEQQNSLQTNKDRTVDGADIISRVLIDRIQEFESTYAEGDSEWEEELLRTGALCKGVETSSKLAQAYVAALAKKHWDSLSKSFRLAFNYSWDQYVLSQFDIQPSTMGQYVDAVEIFVINRAKPFGSVSVVKRDRFKQPIKQDGVVVMEQREFDPFLVDITKLVRMTPLAKRGLLDSGEQAQKIWSLAMDRGATVAQLEQVIYQPIPPNGSSSNPDLKFELIGDRLVVRSFGESVEIAELYFDMCEDDTAKRGIYRILSVLGIKFEEDQIAQQMEESRGKMLIRIYDNGGEALLNDDHTG